MPVRLLCPELQRKSEKELNEVPDRSHEDIDHIRKWLDKQEHLIARKDEQWLLNFLRGCKFSLEKTKQKIDAFYTLRSIVPEFFTNRDPFLPEIQKVLSKGCYWIPLPKSNVPDAPLVLYIGNGLFDPENIHVVDIMKVNLMIFDILINEDDNFVIAGHHSFLDLKGLSVAHMLQVTPSFVKKSGACFHEAYPGRPKGLHFINMPNMFETILKPFLLGKNENRVSIHSGTYYGNLHKVLPKSVLPIELGGNNGSLNDLIEVWKKKVESYNEWFLDDAKYYSDESKRTGKPKFTNDALGIEGSFRKLNID